MALKRLILVLTLLLFVCTSFNHVIRSHEDPFKDRARDKQYLNEKFLFISMQVWLILGVISLIIMGGLVSGLTIGLMALDKTNLIVLQRSGSQREREYASKILPIRKNSYLLLCTLLVANAIVTETLPILLDKLLFESWQAIFIATGLLLIFAEIIPQAFFTRFGLIAGAKLTWLVKILIFIFSPVAFPLSLLIEKMIGMHQGIQYKRQGRLFLPTLFIETLLELKELIVMLAGDQLTREEVKIMTGVLGLIEKHPAEIMIPLEDVFSLDICSFIDDSLIAKIRAKGYSRIPIFDGVKENLVAILLAKSLISYESIAGMQISQLPLAQIYRVRKSVPLIDLLAELRQGQYGHLALVIDDKDNGKPIGIITLEDVIEELLQDEIIDETDEFIDTPIPSSYLASKIATAQSLACSEDESVTSPFIKKEPNKLKKDKHAKSVPEYLSSMIEEKDFDDSHKERLLNV